MIKKVGKEFFIVGVVLIAFSLILSMSIRYLIYAHQIWSFRIILSSQSNSPDVMEEISLKSFSFSQLVMATDNFKEEIGMGASGRVFKGFLIMVNGEKEIAVKKLENDGGRLRA